jgi:DNA-binding response OmpR family regulator
MRALKPDVPILMYSGLTTVPDDVDGQVDAFLVKGRPVEELVQQLENLLRSRKRPSYPSESPGVRKSA